MRKIAAILFLIIQLYSLGGYLALHAYQSYRSNQFFNQQAAKGLYNTKDLEEVQVPVDLPGIRDWSRYENISGQIRFGDNAYNYVQMRITRHVLFLKCVPNYRSTKLNAENILHAEPIKNVPVPQKDHVPYVGIVYVDLLNTNVTRIAFEPHVTMIIPLNSRYLQQEGGHYVGMPKQPPKSVC